MKDTFDNQSSELGRIRKRNLQELKTKELEDELRIVVSGSQEEV
jgi:hypothetical protein